MQGFKKWLSLYWRSHSIWGGALPVSPAGYVLEIVVEGAVLEVLGAGDAGTTARIDEIVEFDGSRAPVFGFPAGGDGSVGVIVVVVVVVIGELDRRDADAVEGLGPGFGRVFEHQVVGLGAYDVPGEGVGAGFEDEVGVLG